jgi:hypothetical protein
MGPNGRSEGRVMQNETIQIVGKYVIALVIIVGCFLQIHFNTGPGLDNSAYVGLIGLIVGWVVRDSAGQQATSNATKVIAANTLANAGQINPPPAA